MTLYEIFESENPPMITCGVCGAEFETRNLLSSSALGSPDLDSRPPEMYRSTMNSWIKVCPQCGYVHSKIEKPAKELADFISSKEYVECEGTSLKTESAKNFYRYALILLRQNDKKGASDVFLWAAWASDDEEDTDGAIICRKKAIEYWDTEDKGIKHLLVKADILRRCGGV